MRFNVEYTEVSVYNTTVLLHIHYIICIQGDMFRPLLGHPQALKEYGSGYIYTYVSQKRIVGSQMLTGCYRGIM
jgi:hypothetical protein